MKKEQVLKMLGLEKLPKASNECIGRCAALVDRGRIKDYVIAKNGVAVTDSDYRVPIKKIIEFYPEIEETREEMTRQEMIEFVKKNEIETKSMKNVDLKKAIEDFKS